MIIVEGPDNAGKSTLVARIAEEFGSRVELSHHSRLAGKDRDELWKSERARVYGALMHGVQSQGVPRICDRLFFSELVYGPVWRGKTTWNPTEERHICRVLTAISPPIIFCLPPFEVVTNNIADHHQLAQVRDTIEQIYKGYVALSNLARPKITKYDYTKGPAATSRVLRVVETYLERREKRTW